MTNKLILAAKGFCMGAADVVPGVSGGTMAFILGIYAKLLNAIRSFDVLWLQHIFKLEFKAVLQRPPEPIYGLFFGLIVGSIIALLPEAKRLDMSAVFFISMGTVLGWLIVNLVPVNTPDSAWFIFLSGMLAISAMLLPGISGSFILLILRKYDTILNAIGHFQFTILIPFCLGVLTGLIVFSRVIGLPVNMSKRMEKNA